ncbi:hypothetical protein QCM80_22975 [Bradyrhizobium sp. SSUT112]|uniref:hypothetical protein n=1 Tax=Bradyrhizobium sp. SSUT112 TaxID=3040604 RepID=UPI00244AF6D8|nr:hypothetical protein [Bradyrhizobium sp. SSUT112]MDH2353501.1 hypothetical protein [Bradyrhizobium sp. SSUT112]
MNDVTTIAPTVPTTTDIPSDPGEAATALAARMSDKSWADGFLRGGPQLAEYQKLSEVAAKKIDTDNVSLAMEGKYLPVNNADHITMMGTAGMLREAGIESDVIRQVLSGGPVTAEERATAEKAKAILMRNSDFGKKLISGDAEAREHLTLLNIIITSDVK